MAIREGDGAPGKPRVVVSMADAARDLARQKRRREDPPPAMARGGVSPGKWTPNNLGLPKEPGCECPLEPLGVEGEVFHLIDSTGQFRSMTAGDFSHAGIQSLFASTPNYPQWAWPRYGRARAPKEGEQPKPPAIESFKDDQVRQAIFLACTRKGLFSPRDKLRGRGAWTMKGGQIIYHAGEELWLWNADKERPQLLETGAHEGFLYARFPALPAPWTEPIGSADNPAGRLLETFRKWNWTRPEIDPVLLLGWIGVAFLGGALEYRSAVILLGDKGTGKSSLQDGLKALFGDALFHSADTTAAGIYQQMKNDTRPIAIDELEPGADGRKIENVVTLMRDSASGAIGRRGSADGTAGQFTMRSAFLFSAINNPLHKAQDLSRVAALRLQPLKEGQTKAPAIDADTCGRMVLAILMREWPNFEDRLDAYMGALSAGGHDARGQKTYGTLLAVADLLLGGDKAAELGVPLTDDLEWWTENLSAESLPEIEDAVPNWRGCLEWLLTVRVDAWRAGKHISVGAVMERLRNSKGTGTGGFTLEEARGDLAEAGLGVLAGPEIDGAVAGFVLAIPNAHPETAKLYLGTPWENVWKDALRQCPVDGVMLASKTHNRVQIGGVQKRCTLVVMDKYQKAPER